MRVLGLVMVAIMMWASASSWAAEPAALDTLVADLAVRYVNEEVITLGDIKERNRQRLAERNRRQQSMPRTNEDWRSFAMVSLEELSDEALLLQFAQERQIQLDPQRIATVVYERAKASGQGLTVAEQSRERKRVARRETINAVIAFFDGKTELISPSQVWAAYHERRQDFRRPARAKVYQMLIRPTHASELEQIRRTKVDLFTAAQESHDKAIAAKADACVEARLSVPVEEQARLLDALIGELAAMPTEGMDGSAKALIGKAAAVVETSRTVRTGEQAFAQLETIRAEIAGKGVEAFKQAAKTLSQGPRSEQGGDMGWVEPGLLTPAVDQQVFSLASGGLSPVFWSDDLPYLVLVEAQEEATQRSFAEVSGEIEVALRQQRLTAIRAQASTILRKQASIRDLVDLNDVLR